MNQYARNASGNVIHRLECTVPGVRVEWKWAEGKSEAQLRQQLEPVQLADKGGKDNYRFCKVCFVDVAAKEELERLQLKQTLKAMQGLR